MRLMLVPCVVVFVAGKLFTAMITPPLCGLWLASGSVTADSRGAINLQPWAVAWQDPSLVLSVLLSFCLLERLTRELLSAF